MVVWAVLHVQATQCRIHSLVIWLQAPRHPLKKKGYRQLLELQLHPIPNLSHRSACVMRRQEESRQQVLWFVMGLTAAGRAVVPSETASSILTLIAQSQPPANMAVPESQEHLFISVLKNMRVQHAFTGMGLTQALAAS